VTLPNADIRAKILRILYDFQMANPAHLYSTDELAKLFPDVPSNLFDANIIYLRDSYLIQGRGEFGQVGPRDVKITKRGIDVVERPERYSRDYSLNFQVLNVNTNYGQVAQGSQGATIIQTQEFSSFGDLVQLVKSRKELTTEEEEGIVKVLRDLEKAVAEGGLSKRIVEDAKHALVKYGWLIPPLVQVLTKAMGLG
jgi:hypothetical protein